jgi:lipopolysaccharide transport system ATP-binding protein
VDEVLAVGDEHFQKKCLGKIGAIAQEGRTVLFVSHNLGIVRSLCGRALLLDSGVLQAIGTSEEIVHKYLSQMDDQSCCDLSERTDRDGTGELKCVKITFLNSSKNEVSFLYPGQYCYLQLNFKAKRTGLTNVKVGIGIDDSASNRIVTLYSDFTGESFEIHREEGRFICAIPELNLRPGPYSVSIFLGNEYCVLDVVLHASKLEVQDSNFYGTGRLPDKSQGPFLVRHSWSIA